MSKTTPVRWWRDDATRYQKRGPQRVPVAALPDPGLMYELLAPHDPAMTRELEQILGVVGPSAIAAAMLSPQTFGPNPITAWNEAKCSPLEDLLHAMASLL